jgi:hypothetical protein
MALTKVEYNILHEYNAYISYVDGNFWNDRNACIFSMDRAMEYN